MSKTTGVKPTTTAYSRETLTIIEDCMKALNLTTLQKATILTDLKNGKSVPLFALHENSRSRIRFVKPKPIFISRRPKKRRRETMVSSGAYDIPQFAPEPRVDREAEKERLQNICFGIDEIPSEEESTQNETTNLNLDTKFFKHERMKELMNEIEERIQFLDEVEKFGLKRKYELEIKNEISQKLKQLQKLSENFRGVNDDTTKREEDEPSYHQL